MIYSEEMSCYPFNSSDLRSVCAKYAEGLEVFLEPVSLDFKPSDAHKKVIRSLTDNSLHKAKRHALYRRVGTIAAVFVLFFGTIMVTNAHAREMFARWMKQILPDRVLYRFYGEPEGGLYNYRIGWIPEGFELVQSYEYKNNRVYGYRSNDGGFNVGFHTISDGFVLEIGGEGDEFKSLPVRINGVKGTYYYDIHDSSKNLVWITADENVEIDI